jgi:hypothetical protein
LLARLGVLVRTVALAAVLLVPVAILAGWLERLAGAPGGTAADITPALENALRYVRTLPVRADAVPVAAQDTRDGRWRFVNKAGEVLTAGTPEEMKRLVPVLYPEARAGARPAVYVTADTVLRDRAALKALPAGIELSVVVAEESYRLLRRSDAAGERWYAEIRPNLVIEIGDRHLFEEAVWQLARPLDKAGVRVLALEPGGPTLLPPSPRFDRERHALVDAIDPASLVPAMRGVAGQTLVLVGRIERDLMHVKPSRGPERVLVTKELFKGADGSGANMVLLGAATPRQPHGRNWLWLRAQRPGGTVRHARMADFLNALATPGHRLAVVALPLGERTVLDLLPVGDLPGSGPQRPVAEFFANVVAELTGKAPATAVQANLRSAERQHELDQRFLPGIPSGVQIAYGVLAVLGLLGVPVARTWWQRLWPPEAAGDYAGHTGYWAARATRGAAFALVFVPLTALVSAPCNLGRQVQEAVMAPLRLWRRERRAPAAPPAAEPVAEPVAKPAYKAPARAKAPPPGRPAAAPSPAARPVAVDNGAHADMALSDPDAADRPRFLTRR